MANSGWSDALSVGVEEIDREHEELIGLFQGLSGAKDRAAVMAALDDLVAHVCTHFDHEERIMRNHGFPESAGHARAHDALLRQVRNFVMLVEAEPDGAPGPDIMDFVGKWLVEHILGDDRRLGDYIRARARVTEPV